MDPSYLLRLVAKNMWRRRLRTLLTVAGITVAIVSFGMLRTIVDAWVAGAEDTASAGRLIVRNATSLAFPLPILYGQKIRQLPGIDTVTWASWFGGVYVDERNFFAQLAVDSETYFAAYPEYVLPPAQLRAFRGDRAGAVVGRRLAEKYGFRVGDSIPLRGTLYPGTWNFTVRGIYDGAGDNVDTAQMFIHWDYLNERVRAVLPSRANVAGVFVVNVRRAADAPRISALIDSTFRNSLAETRTETQKAFQLGFVAMVDTILAAIQAVAGVVIAVILAVMANTMAMTARERTREYATLKAMGFPPAVVAQLVLGESLAIALVGGAIGIAATFPIANAFWHATGKMFAVFAVTPATVAWQVAATLAVGLLAALVPAWQGARVDITAGLRAIA